MHHCWLPLWATRDRPRKPRADFCFRSSRPAVRDFRNGDHVVVRASESPSLGHERRSGAGAGMDDERARRDRLHCAEFDLIQQPCRPAMAWQANPCGRLSLARNRQHSSGDRVHAITGLEALL